MVDLLPPPGRCFASRVCNAALAPSTHSHAVSLCCGAQRAHLCLTPAEQRPSLACLAYADDCTCARPAWKANDARATVVSALSALPPQTSSHPRAHFQNSLPLPREGRRGRRWCQRVQQLSGPLAPALAPLSHARHRGAPSLPQSHPASQGSRPAPFIAPPERRSSQPAPGASLCGRRGLRRSLRPRWHHRASWRPSARPRNCCGSCGPPGPLCPACPHSVSVWYRSPEGRVRGPWPCC